VEKADENVTTIDPLTVSGTPQIARLSNTDPLPGVNLIYALSPRQNLRFGYSRTVSRPDFRELSPFDFTNVAGGFTVIGNPNLKRATIDNVDVRWEYFPAADQLVAFSYFYKLFDDPIETTIQATASLRQSFLNADAARNQGIEAEFRRGLRFLHPKLAGLVVAGNVTLVKSNVEIPPEQLSVLTSQSRAMMGQSRYIVNASVEWLKPSWRSNFRFYSNIVARRITDVGTIRLPDIYQERNALLDFVYQFNLQETGKWQMRFSAENLGDNQYRFTQGNSVTRRYNLGRTFTIGTSYTFF
jgi:TonB-dependent receptor